MAALRTGHPDAAVSFFTSWVKSHPKDLEAAEALLRAHLAVGRADVIEEVFAALPAGARQGSTIVQLRARAAEALGEQTRAESILGDARQRAPGDLALAGALLDLRVRTGRTPKTDAEAKRLTDLLYDAYDAGKVKGPAELLAVARATLASGTGGGYHDANEVLGEAAAMEPPSRGTWLSDEIALLHARIFLEKYDTDEATRIYAAVLERDPWHPDALAGLAWVQLADLRLARATRTATEALLVNPRQRLAHAAIAYVDAIELRHHDARRRVDEGILAVDPSDQRGHAVKAAIAIWEGDRDAYAQARAAVARGTSRPIDFHVVLSEILNVLHLYPECGDTLTDGLAVANDAPELLAAQGLNLLRLGDETRGRALLEHAWKRDRFNERTFNMRRLYAERIEPHYELRKFDGFELRYPKEDGALVVEDFALAITRARSGLAPHYPVDPGSVRVELFAHPEEFSVRTIGIPALGALGVCFGPVITMVGPHAGRFDAHQVVWHELAHTSAIALSKGRVPRWFTEGLSEWETELADPAWARESAQLLTYAQSKGSLPHLATLELAFLRAESGAAMEVAYATATYAVRWIGETWGREAIVALLRGWGSGKRSEELLPAVLGRSLDQLDRDFEVWLQGELQQRVSGFRPELVAADHPGRVALEEALRAFEGPTPEAAAARLLKLAADPDTDGAVVRLALARARMEQGRFDDAKLELEAARRFDKESTTPDRLAAKIARHLSDVDAERRHLMAVLQVEPTDVDAAITLLGLALVTDDEAAELLAAKRLVAVVPTRPEGLAAAALLHRREPLAKDLAKTLLSAAVDRSSDDAEAAVVVALVAAKAGQAEVAASIAKKATGAKNLAPVVHARLVALAK
jgi:tetratricopeptide (TPR) repeat protein